jgi:hypothetical protein
VWTVLVQIPKLPAQSFRAGEVCGRAATPRSWVRSPIGQRVGCWAVRLSTVGVTCRLLVGWVGPAGRGRGTCAGVGECQDRSGVRARG